ncbi:MAG TPA: RT0821/Lpp0805 family surface protein [Gammaproteobacteria bacterium]|nr:RT0821/Lpp0805 family surface protein [Gammaproteobacteria bacterium]
MSGQTSIRWTVSSVLLGASLALAVPPPVSADPPPWAPAWGYRAKGKYKHKHKGRVRYERYDETEYVHRTRDYGIYYNTCDRETIGALIGGAVGGLAGSQIGKGDGRVAAAVAGTVIGVIVGREIGRSMDQIDQTCTGQVLERAQTHQTVTWRNPDSRATYNVTPTSTFESDGRYCREYVTEALINGRRERVTGTACRESDGTWRKVSG